MTTSTTISYGISYLDQSNFFGMPGRWNNVKFKGEVVCDRALTANYRALIRAGKKVVQPLPYKHSETTFRLGNGWWLSQKRRNLPGEPWETTWYFKGFGLPQDAGLTSPPHPRRSSTSTEVNSVVTIVKNRAIIKAIGQVKNQNINVAQAFAERKMSYATVGDAASKIAAMYRNLRRGDLKEAAFVLGLTVSKRGSAKYRRQHSTVTRTDDHELGKVLSNGVLQLQYGWKPLLNDVFGAVKQIEGMHQAGFAYPVRTLAAGISQNFEFSNIVNEGACRVTSTYVGKASSTVTLAWKTSDPNLALANQIGISNPATIAWELMPWSFVIDWFIPIGNYINCFNATDGLQFLNGSMSHKLEVSLLTQLQWTPAISYDPWGNFAYRSAGYCLYSEKKRSFSREVLSSFPNASFPGLKNPASLEHAINAIALLRGLKK